MRWVGQERDVQEPRKKLSVFYRNPRHGSFLLSVIQIMTDLLLELNSL